MNENARVIGTAPWLIGVAALAELVFTGGAVALFVLQGPSLWLFALVALALAASLAVVETVVSRVILSEDTLEIRSLRSRRSIPARDIRRVRGEGGSGVAVQLATGTWVQLPVLGHSAQSVANTIQAWLRSRDGEGDQEDRR